MRSQNYHHFIDSVVPDITLCYLPFLDSGLHTDYVPNDEETQALSKFLSELSLTDVGENEISLSSENMPEEFHLIYNRCCKRTQYEISPGLTIILSKERSWRSSLHLSSLQCCASSPSACFVLAHHSQSTPSLLSLSQPFSLRPRCASSSSSRGYGATAARLTPDQKVRSSNLSGLILFSELVLSGLPQPELWLPCQLPSLAPPWPEGQGVLLLVQRVWGSSPTGGVCPSGLPSRFFFSYILPVQGRCSPCPCL